MNTRHTNIDAKWLFDCLFDHRVPLETWGGDCARKVRHLCEKINSGELTIDMHRRSVTFRYRRVGLNVLCRDSRLSPESKLRFRGQPVPLCPDLFRHTISDTVRAGEKAINVAKLLSWRVGVRIGISPAPVSVSSEAESFGMQGYEGLRFVSVCETFNLKLPSFLHCSVGSYVETPHGYMRYKWAQWPRSPRLLTR